MLSSNGILILSTETNIMVQTKHDRLVSCNVLTYPQVGTHADSLIAEAVVKGVRGFDLDTAWSAVLKDATVPPEDDWTIL